MNMLRNLTDILANYLSFFGNLLGCYVIFEFIYFYFYSTNYYHHFF